MGTAVSMGSSGELGEGTHGMGVGMVVRVIWDAGDGGVLWNFRGWFFWRRDGQGGDVAARQVRRCGVCGVWSVQLAACM